ncbi:hypothetical protein KJ785_03385 [Patescibacteria group bacterium]|nr:hypothetical protein [Patescibacteria group bacterium]
MNNSEKNSSWSIEALDIEKERLLLGSFFNSRSLNINNLDAFVKCLKNLISFHLASPAEWLSRFLFEIYKSCDGTIERVNFANKIKEWAEVNVNNLQFLSNEQDNRPTVTNTVDSIEATIDRF